VPERLRNKVVVVTGAATGIGRALARRFARAGACLGLLDVDLEGLEGLSSELECELSIHECDVRDAQSCSQQLAEVVDRFGGIDVLINNAGISHRSLFADTQLDVIRRVMEVNFFGAVHCTQAALPSLVARRGTVVAISSVAGFAPLVGRCGYAASKHALHGFFDSLRAELRSAGVNVMLICPSFVDTKIDQHALGADGGGVARRKSTVGRLLTPEHIADEVAAGVAQGRQRILPSMVAKTSYWLWSVWPAAYERLMRHSQRDELTAH